MITVKFTKVFTDDSLLAGITYQTEVEIPTQERADSYLAFLKKHTVKPIKACAGSHYTVKDIEVI